ncbi:MAG: glycosyltransferase family 4 protein [Planctomycetota bacterium]
MKRETREPLVKQVVASLDGEAPLAERPRVALLTRDDPAHARGGVETFCEHLQRALSVPLVLAYGGAAGRRLIFNEARDAFATMTQLVEAVSTHGIDVVVANGAAAWALDPKRWSRDLPPVITVYHGTYAGFGRATAAHSPVRGFWARHMGALLERRAGHVGAATVAVSPSVAREVEHFYRLHARVIPNAVMLRSVAVAQRDEVRRRWSLPVQASVGLFVGRGTWAKGFDLVLQLARARPSLTVVAAGVEPRRGLAPNVRALGILTREEVGALYAGTDVVVLPSRYEGCSYVPLEAMAAGCPVVVSAVGAFEEPGPQPFGAVVPPGERNALLAAVDEVLASPSRFDPRRYVARHFGFEPFASAWKALLAEVLHGA